MNKFCKSSLCVEKVRESYVLIGQRVVVAGSVDAIRLALLVLISVKLLLWCRLPAPVRLLPNGLEDSQPVPRLVPGAR